jgi:hypothetical protein
MASGGSAAQTPAAEGPTTRRSQQRQDDRPPGHGGNHGGQGWGRRSAGYVSQHKAVKKGSGVGAWRRDGDAGDLQGIPRVGHRHAGGRADQATARAGAKAKAAHPDGLGHHGEEHKKSDGDHGK